MILADTSVWIDYLRVADADLGSLLLSSEVLTHPHVLGEVALGGLSPHSPTMRMLMGLPQALVASDEEVFRLIEHEKVGGSGIGYVDCHLLASARLTPDAKLWTHDRRLHALAVRFGVARTLTSH